MTARPLLPAAIVAIVVLLPADRGAAQVLDPQLERQRERELEQRTRRLETFEGSPAQSIPGMPGLPGGPCFDIVEVVINGATVLTQGELGAIAGRFVPGCLQGADIQNLMRAIDAEYAERGYITTRTYIPPQNITGGRLVLQVIEGRVEGLFIIDEETDLTDTPRGRRQLATAFPGTEGDLFQLRDFEQGLEQMNRLASVDATLLLRPGDEPGGSFVIVERLQADRFRGFFRADNLGSPSSGRNTLALNTEFDDVFGANDTWLLGFSGSVNSNALTFSGSVPWGYWTASTYGYYSEYLTPLTTDAELFGTTGTVNFELRRMLARNQTTTTGAGAKIELRRIERFINDVQLAPQSLTVLSFGIDHLRLGDSARDSFDLGLSLGLNTFGADDDDPLRDVTVPRSQFFKVSADWQRQAAVAGGTWVADVSAQWAPHTLFGSERLSLGSYSTVRGYEFAIAAGDSGFYMRNDWYLPADFWGAFWPPGTAEPFSARTQVNLFADFGIAWDHALKTRQGAAGAGIGLTWYHDYATLSGIVAMPLVTEGPLGLKRDPIVQLWLSAKAW